MARRTYLWLALAVLVVAALAAAHVQVNVEHSRRVADVRREGVALTTPHRLIRQDFTLDGHLWIRFAESLLERPRLQLRETQIDNAPAGREVHWNSAYAWWLAGLGRIWEAATGLPRGQAMEAAAMWANLPLLLGFSALLGAWALRREGLAAGLAVAFAFVGQMRLSEVFWPGYADHHGIAAGSVLAMLLGALWMRGGWLRAGDAAAEARARAASLWSGIWGGVALWISASTAVPSIALVAVAAVLATLAGRKALGAEMFSARVWRVWGLSGAATSLALYLLEYFPGHLGLRLEVNHPLHALAWLAGAELCARLLPWIASGGRERLVAMLRCAAWALPVVAAPALLMLLLGATVFIPADPFVAGLHRSILEFLPLGTRLGSEGLLPHHDVLLLIPFLVLVAGLLLACRGVDRWSLGFALSLLLPLVAAGFLQARWIVASVPAQILLLVACLGGLGSLQRLEARPRLRAAVQALLVVIILAPGLVLRAREARLLALPAGLSRSDYSQLLYREAAQVLRESQPQGEIVVLASPNASANLAFFGDFRVIGTLYWENAEGLKAAAAILSAATEDEAAALIRRRGITHLALFSDCNFLVEYARLARPGISDAEIRRSFAHRILVDRVIPPWLQAIPYAPPSGLPPGIDPEVLLFKVNFEQKPAEAAYHIGMLQMRRGELDGALQAWAMCLQLDPAFYAAPLRGGEFLLSKGQPDRAFVQFELATRAAPAAERYRLWTQAGIAFSQSRQHRLAIESYGRALQCGPNNVIAANNLAWLLATTPDAALRNPARAIQLARGSLASDPGNPNLADTLATAHAAAGRHADAVRILEQVLAFAPPDGGDLVNRLRAHLELFRQGKSLQEP